MDEKKISDNPRLVDKFNKNYLTNLNLYLDSKRFMNKMESLPNLKSTAILKLEKLVDKESKNSFMGTKSKNFINGGSIDSYKKKNNKIDKNKKRENFYFYF